MNEFNKQKIDVWEQILEGNTDAKLDMFLLTRDAPLKPGDDGLLNVNFDPMLVRLLREVKYLKLLGHSVPEKAISLFERVDVYRTQSGNLDLIVGMYNNILSTLIPVEKPLLAKWIERINKEIEACVSSLKWNKDRKEIDPVIDYNFSIVTDVD